MSKKVNSHNLVTSTSRRFRCHDLCRRVGWIKNANSTWHCSRIQRSRDPKKATFFVEAASPRTAAVLVCIIYTYIHYSTLHVRCTLKGKKCTNSQPAMAPTTSVRRRRAAIRSSSVKYDLVNLICHNAYLYVFYVGQALNYKATNERVYVSTYIRSLSKKWAQKICM